MQQALIVDNSRIAAVVRLDLGDEKSRLCRLELDGRCSVDQAIATSRVAAGLSKRAAGEQPPSSHLG